MKTPTHPKNKARVGAAFLVNTAVLMRVASRANLAQTPAARTEGVEGALRRHAGRRRWARKQQRFLEYIRSLVE